MGTGRIGTEFNRNQAILDLGSLCTDFPLGFVLPHLRNRKRTGAKDPNTRTEQRECIRAASMAARIRCRIAGTCHLVRGLLQDLPSKGDGDQSHGPIAARESNSLLHHSIHSRPIRPIPNSFQLVLDQSERSREE